MYEGLFYNYKIYNTIGGSTKELAGNKATAWEPLIYTNKI